MVISVKIIFFKTRVRVELTESERKAVIEKVNSIKLFEHYNVGYIEEHIPNFSYGIEFIEYPTFPYFLNGVGYTKFNLLGYDITKLFSPDERGVVIMRRSKNYSNNMDNSLKELISMGIVSGYLLLDEYIKMLPQLRTSNQYENHFIHTFSYSYIPNKISYSNYDIGNYVRGFNIRDRFKNIPKEITEYLTSNALTYSDIILLMTQLYRNRNKNREISLKIESERVRYALYC